MSSGKSHPYHLVDPSPWPIFGAFSLLILASGAITFIHNYSIGNILLPSGFVLVFLTMYLWWKDVVKEARIDYAHTSAVQHGLRIGMALFILSEVMFFFAFFWAFFKASIFPVALLEGAWPIAEGVWPPKGIVTFDPWDIPFINTLILLLSGTTVTWSHYAILEKNKKDAITGLWLTVILGISFTLMQAYEYAHAAFGFKDGIYSSTFYMATGFHGFHVLVGTIFLIVCLIRAQKGQFNVQHHLGFEFAAWYWHFVDVVWLFLFACVYIWGA